MIQDLKNDSARWEQERRKHSSGGTRASRDSPDVFVRSRNSNSPPGPNRYGGYGGAQGPSTYETSEPSYPSGSNRDSYEVLPRYPGSDAPGYSGSGGSAYQQEYPGQQPTGYPNAQYSSGQQYPPPQPGTSGYNTQPAGAAGAYSGQAQYSNAYGQPDTNTPYVNVGANHAYQDPRAPVDASSRGVYSGYPSQGQADPRSSYYSQNQAQTGYTQPVDPFLGRGNAYPTSQADYSTSTQPTAYQYVSDTPQYESANQTPPPPRAVTSPSTSTNAQTGNSGTSHSRHHRDRDQRDGRDSRSERHSRRP